MLSIKFFWGNSVVREHVVLPHQSSHKQQWKGFNEKESEMNETLYKVPMMTSSIGSNIRVIGHLCGEFTGYRWIPRTKANDAEFYVFCGLRLNKRLSGLRLVVWDAIAPIVTSLQLQGSIIGWLLFLFCIDDLPDYLTYSCLCCL